jgi:hypothetical protein
MSLNVSNHMIENTHVHICLNLIGICVSYSVQNLLIWKNALVSNNRTNLRFGTRRRCATSFALGLLYPAIKVLNGPKILFLHTK